MNPLRTLRAGPPPPPVALLPDGLFFTRTIPIAPGATPAEAAAQIELAIETVAPFPLAQLYYGSHWLPDSPHALVFAAYRRRFTVEQTTAWTGAALVVPAFAALLGAAPAPGTTIILAAADGLTAVHWGDGPVPTSVLHRPLPPAPEEETDATLARADAARAALRDELIRATGGSRTVIDLDAPPAAQPAPAEGALVFRAGELDSPLPAPVVAALDVRDKAELATLRAARRRDVLLWNVMFGSVAALLLLALAELALVGARQWQAQRKKKQVAQLAVVERIMDADALTRRIEDLRTKRLLPLEMIELLNEKRPTGGPGNEIVFTSVQTVPAAGLYTLKVNARTANPGLIGIYRTELVKHPGVEKADFTPPLTRDNNATFTFTVTFKPEALQPPAPPPP
ncbi:MAG: hypothetical protein RLZZ15_1541 [Verrucomicrobiota bacterium]|jgi:hypothetical protein